MAEVVAKLNPVAGNLEGPEVKLNGAGGILEDPADLSVGFGGGAL